MSDILSHIMKNKRHNRICITTYFDDAFSAIGNLSFQTLEMYAKQHNLDAIILNNIVSDRPLPWHKILIIKELFDEDYDYVIWIDADAIFVDSGKSLAEELEEGKDLYLVKHQIDSRVVPNTGVMVIKNSIWSRIFLDMVWEKEQYINHKWWENAAILDMLGYHGLLDETQPDNLNQNLIGKIKWLGLEWNSLPNICESDRPIIKHYAGRPMEYRLAHMKQDLEVFIKGNPII